MLLLEVDDGQVRNVDHRAVAHADIDVLLEQLAGYGLLVVNKTRKIYHLLVAVNNRLVQNTALLCRQRLNLLHLEDGHQDFVPVAELFLL